MSTEQATIIPTVTVSREIAEAFGLNGAPGVTIAPPEPAPQIIEVPAIVRRTTYVPDESAWIDRTVYDLFCDHSIPVEPVRITGSKDAGSWRHEYRTGLDLSVTPTETRALSLYVYGSNNKRQALRIVAGAFTFVCSNGQFFGRTELDIRTRHTVYVRSRARAALAGVIRKLPEFRQIQIETDRKALEIEFSNHRAHSLNYRGFLAGAWSAETAKALAKEIDHPTFGDFAAPTLYHVRERFTTVFRDLQPAQQARALEHLASATARA